MSDKYQDQFCAVPELHGHVMAIDGLAIRIQTPHNTETGNVMSYKNRKGFLSVNMQAGCDSSLKFRFVSIMTAGSTHDNTAFLVSEDSSLWENDKSEDLFGDLVTMHIPVPETSLIPDQALKLRNILKNIPLIFELIHSLSIKPLMVDKILPDL